MNNILTNHTRNPYYIVAARYVRTSAGIRALHLLCHALNLAGERAYMIINPFHPRDFSTHPDLLTPHLTPQVLESHYKRGITPITVYPETIGGNPYNSPFVVRYVLNYPGLLGGDKKYDPNEFCITYSKKLEKSINNSRMTLFIPTSDPGIFNNDKEEHRKGTCFYAAKYQDYHHGKLLPITNNSIEITRGKPNSQTPQQIADILRKSEVFYCYENSALVIEAILCGCPVVFLPNEFLTESLGSEEIGWDGIAWGTNPEEIERAKKTVNKGRERYLYLFEKFSHDLSTFIRLTQNEVSSVRYESPVQIPFYFSWNSQGSLGKILIAVDIFRFTAQNSGLRYAIFKFIRRILRKGFSLDLDGIGL